MHARPWCAASIDFIAQFAIESADVGTHVANGGEAGYERCPCIFAGKGEMLFGAAPRVDSKVCGVLRQIRQMGMQVDQARKTSVFTQVEIRCFGGWKNFLI